MGLFVADTHALVWYLSGSSRLSQSARQVFEATSAGTHEIVVPAIVIAELVMLAERRPGLVDAAKVVARLRATRGYRLSSLDPNTSASIGALAPLPDIHDRLIVAEARALHATILTRDEVITASGLALTLW
jgi:PIN domain nuclease of toxin-antitoxin system